MITRNPDTPYDSTIRDTPTHEDHPTEFIVEGRDRQTQIWRRMVVHADDKNEAVDIAQERGVAPELVREAKPAERPMTGIDAPQREFGFGGVMSVALTVLGVLSVAIALIMRDTSPSFAIVVGIIGALITIYGVVGTTAFWVLSRANRDAR
jgi:hypothetical protein